MRKFSDEERERIREKLLETARELLLKFGPTKTTVRDITEPVGIAKPTFYQFFDAKSDLYVEIFQQELDEFAKTLESELAGVDDPQERLEQFFRCYVEFGEGNEFIQEVFIKRDYREVLGDVSSDQLAEIERKEMEVLVPPIRDIQARSDGPVSEMEPMTVLGLMGSALGLSILHKDEYDEISATLDEIQDGIYPHLQREMITTLARGLTVEG
ncbi:TetR/AcrR family transcriptional regulator [Halosimplex rubrum]|uniref:TetR/AcrR family transcriptional regulator n=1 Tax=Halosimplex rubrum TaxID=869889 RepID=A0A7D5P2K4_9EURY|nr:helix-turn-helix domain-containing protein [Halosimplex rubrum]QLH79157.1 TetR/AcrR family transcriptional regulator [Halosimplex rubrum]